MPMESKNIFRRRLKRSLTVLFLVMTVLLAACNAGDGLQTKDSDAEDDAAKAEVKRGVKPEPDEQVAVLDTDYGEIVIELYPNIAPKTVERFKKLASEGFYNRIAFHRVEPFVIQGGDPNSKDDNPSNDGAGGSPYPDLPAEPSDLPFDAGTVGAADAGLGTANSQFYITLRPMPQWSGRYTAFGRVIKGMNNATIISGAPVIPGTKNPDPKILIKSVTLQARQK